MGVGSVLENGVFGETRVGGGGHRLNITLLPFTRATDGKQAKNSHYGFIKMTFRDLKTGKKRWSEITREDWQFVESDKECIYCGAKEDFQKEHIVPKSIRIKPECAFCDTIQSIHNQVWGCKTCNSKKSTMGLYSYY